MTLHSSVVALLNDWPASNSAQDTLRHAVLAFLHARTDACARECAPGHITASALVLDHTGSQALLTLHPRVGRWVQLGGHCEATDSDILTAALREATEESGVDGLRIDPHLIAVHVHPVTCSLGVPTRHLDLQFLAHAPAGAQIGMSDESVDLRWWPIDALPDDADDALLYLVRRAVKTSRHGAPSVNLASPSTVDSEPNFTADGKNDTRQTSDE